MRLLRTGAALFAVLLLTLPAVAQEQTGSIVGVVKDSSGAVLPGVTVEARSPSAVGVSTATTDSNGSYRFPALPPGAYEVSASLKSFLPAKFTDAVVTLGKQLSMHLDFIQEVQVKSAGYAAEFGGATGGVVNVLTKSGRNQFHGQGGTYYQNQNMQGDIRPQVRFNPQHTNVAESGLITPDDSWTYWSPLGDIGGPIFPDNVWFYGSAA